MTTRLNRQAYQQLVDEDVAWLEKQPRTLEREHVILIVKSSVGWLYDPFPEIDAKDKRIEELRCESQVYVE